jgi:hypothetical protein
MKRREGHRRVGRRILVVCEGEQTERHYFNTLRQTFRLSTENLMVRVAGGGSPEKIVDIAIQALTKASSSQPEAGLDAVWVVFDAERGGASRASHAVEAAVRAGVTPALSNPCFEFWLLLHERSDAPQLTAAEAKRRCDKRLGVPGSANAPAAFDDARLTASWQRAAENARAVRLRAANDESMPEEPAYAVVLARNPNTNVDQLVEVLASARPSATG